LAFRVLALAVACGKTCGVTFYQPSVAAGIELKPGEYRLDLNGNKVTLWPSAITTRARSRNCSRRGRR
jgi:hypothetical protein